MGNAGGAGDGSAAGIPAAVVLQRVIDAGGRLLRVEETRQAGGGGRRGVLRLSFDVGLVELRAGAAGLLAQPFAPGGAAPPGLTSGDAVEPWWAVLGNPLARLQARDDGSLLLQFRPDAESPRLFLLVPEAGGIAIRSVV